MSYFDTNALDFKTPIFVLFEDGWMDRVFPMIFPLFYARTSVLYLLFAIERFAI